METGKSANGAKCANLAKRAKQLRAWDGCVGCVKQPPP